VAFQPTVRRRELKGPNLHGRVVHRSSLSNPFVTDYLNRQLKGVQITESEGHAFSGKYTGKDVGGDFRTYKAYCVVNNQSVHMEDLEPPTPGRYQKFDVTMTPRIDDDSSKPFLQLPKSLSFNSDLDSKGAEAVDLCNPLNPVASASTFLAEAIHERLPSLPGIRLWESRTKALLGLGDEFLNAEFGFLPMIREIGDLAKAIQLASITMKQYEKDAGKLVRRSWYFPASLNNSSTILYTRQPPVFGGTGTYTNVFGAGTVPSGRVTRSVEERRKVWFKGAFTYTIPSQSDSWIGMMKAATLSNPANVVFGSNLTPETLWELAPWSWAVDWFSNAQEVITNLQRFELEGLVMPYGYVMDEKTIKTTYTWEQEGVSSFKQPIAVSPVVVVETYKMRKQANPFGFGVEWADLSPTQLAILAALGITFAL